MLALHSFDAMPGTCGIETTNPAMVARLRRLADTLTAHEIAASLEVAILDAADSAHACAFETAQFGEASADVLVDAEYHDDLAAAWSLVACEYQVFTWP